MDTVEKLKIKGRNLSTRLRMSSLKEISKMLTEYNIEHSLETSYNTVEYRSKGNRYVNSRHRGKSGYKLDIIESGLSMDSSDSYYSCNTPIYARQIIKLLINLGKIKE